VDSQLSTLIELQGYDARIAALDAEATRLPKQIEAIQTSLAEAKKTLETLKARIDTGRKELRAKEKDLEVIGAKRTKQEARLYEVKTNKEYSAALLEIEESKQEKAKTEEEILGLMEQQERLNVEIREAEVRFKTREDQGKQDEAVVRKKLAAVEQELGGLRGERTTRARDLPAPLLADYERIAKARGGIAVASVSVTAICGGCRVSIRPQAILELRAGTTVLMRCESCGRFLYWQEAPSPV
jgi:predicted  nucleic acid-binding Zn-ribbon protein